MIRTRHLPPRSLLSFLQGSPFLFFFSSFLLCFIHICAAFKLPHLIFFTGNLKRHFVAISENSSLGTHYFFTLWASSPEINLSTGTIQRRPHDVAKRFKKYEERSPRSSVPVDNIPKKSRSASRHERCRIDEYAKDTIWGSREKRLLSRYHERIR